MKEYSYTSTPPMGRTAYTEPQCLYKGDLYLYISMHIATNVKRCLRCLDVATVSAGGEIRVDPISSKILLL